MKIYDKILSIFFYIYENFEFFRKRRKHVQKSSRWATIAILSLISQKMTELSVFFIFQYISYIILQKFKCMFWHVLKVAQENKWYHWTSVLKLHLTDTFLLLLVIFKI